MAVELNQQRWRRPGCGDGCRREAVFTLAGDGARELREYHDPEQHEAFGSHGAALRQAGTVTVGPLVVDAAYRKATLDGIDLTLTPTEWRILHFLAQRSPEYVAHREVLYWVWGPDYVSSCGTGDIQSEVHLLRVNMARIRAKFGERRDMITSRLGIGYRLVTP